MSQAPIKCNLCATETAESMPPWPLSTAVTAWQEEKKRENERSKEKKEMSCSLRQETGLTEHLATIEDKTNEPPPLPPPPSEMK